MDVNELRIIGTVVSFIAFVGVMVWAFSRRNKQDFEAASKLPFDQE